MDHERLAYKLQGRDFRRIHAHARKCSSVFWRHAPKGQEVLRVLRVLPNLSYLLLLCSLFLTVLVCAADTDVVINEILYLSLIHI